MISVSNLAKEFGDRTVALYWGNYTAFLEQKREDRERREKEIEARITEIARLFSHAGYFEASALRRAAAERSLGISPSCRAVR